MATAEEKEGEEKGGLWREERKWHEKKKRRGREGVIKGTRRADGAPGTRRIIRGEEKDERYNSVGKRVTPFFPLGLKLPRVSLFYPSNSVCTAAAMF